MLLGMYRTPPDSLMLKTLMIPADIFPGFLLNGSLPVFGDHTSNRKPPPVLWMTYGFRTELDFPALLLNVAHQ